MSVELSPRATEIAEHTKILLAAGGYNGFSYADLSKRIHIGKPSIHHHFPSKEDLVLTVVKRHREESRTGLAALSQQIDDPLACLTTYSDYWAKCIHEGTLPICICAMLAAESPILPRDIAGEVQGYFEDLAAWIASVLEKGASRGQFHLRDSAATEAQTLMAMVHGAMLSARATHQPEVFRTVVNAAIHQLTV